MALAFPAFSDGRSFSKAELLRSRHRFEGAVRATGQVLIDQLPHMLRLGFDEFEVSHPVLIKRLEAGDTGGIPLYYQPTAKPAAKGAKYSWRRARSRLIGQLSRIARNLVGPISDFRLSFYAPTP